MTVAPVAHAADISVSDTCSLADAITSANSDTATGGCTAGSGDDTITIPAGTVQELTADLPAITTNMTIEGNGSDWGGDNRRVFNITGGTVTINHINVGGSDASGGAILITGGTVSLSRLAITGSDTDTGGALEITGGSVTISNTSFHNNSMSSDGAVGAGLRISGSASVTISNSSFRENTSSAADSFGGGVSLSSSGAVTISNSDFRQNQAAEGGALYIDSAQTGAVTVVNTSFFDNRSVHSSHGQYAGIYMAGGGSTAVTYTFRHITMYNNTGSNAASGSQFRKGAGGSASVVLANSIIDSPDSNSDCAVTTGTGTGTFTSTNNLVEDGGCSALVSGDPLLLDQQTMGGVAYRALSDMSPAIGRGNDATCAINSADQIGNPRPATGCDLGAVENDLTLSNIQETATALANETATAVQETAEAEETATAEAEGTATAVALTGTAAQETAEFRGTETATHDPQYSARGTANAIATETGTHHPFYSETLAYRQTVAARTPRPTRRPTATPSPIYSTCERMEGSVQINSPSGMPQCNAPGFKGGSDIVANQEIQAAGGYIDAVDIWGWISGEGLEVCFDGTGGLVFLDASTSPRTIYRIASYAGVNGGTCARIDRPGTVVLMNPALISPMWPIAPWSAMPAGSAMSGNMEMMLAGCMVRTEYALFFRGSPGGEVIPPLVVEENALLTALERTADWFKVDYHGAQGWISAQHVSPQGDCG